MADRHETDGVLGFVEAVRRAVRVPMTMAGGPLVVRKVIANGATTIHRRPTTRATRRHRSQLTAANGGRGRHSARAVAVVRGGCFERRASQRTTPA